MEAYIEVATKHGLTGEAALSFACKQLERDERRLERDKEREKEERKERERDKERQREREKERKKEEREKRERDKERQREREKEEKVREEREKEKNMNWSWPSCARHRRSHRKRTDRVAPSFLARECPPLMRKKTKWTPTSRDSKDMLD